MTAPLVVLVVDGDERSRLAVAARRLAAETTVIEARTGEDAKRLARERSPDLVLLAAAIAPGAHDVPAALRAEGVRAPIILLPPTEGLDDAIAEVEQLGAAAARRARAEHAAQLERLAEATHLIHAAPSPQAAREATVAALRLVLGAEGTLSSDGTNSVGELSAMELAPPDQTFELVAPDGPRCGTLTLRRQRALELSEVLIASHIARAAALALDRHRLVQAIQATVDARHEIVTIVSHDLRTPVHAFSLGLDALRATVRSDAAAPIYARLDRALRSMRRLLSDLLDVATIQDGTLHLHAAQHAIPALIASVRAGCVEIGAQKALAIAIGDVAQGLLLCDRARIEQALTNLVGNAMKYTERGRVTLSATAEGDAICFEVSDTGIGMDSQVQAHLFERLYQGPGARSGGVGLGLYIVGGIAEAHGGTVAVSSQLGQGSRFFMRIPRTNSSNQIGTAT